MKRLIVGMANGLVDRLLEILPAIDENLDVKVTEDGSGRIYDEIGNTLVPNWFQRLVLAKAR